MTLARLFPWIAGGIVAYLIFRPAPAAAPAGLRLVVVDITGSTLATKTGIGGWTIGVEPSMPTSYDAAINQAWRQSSTTNNPTYITNMINTLHDAGYPIAAAALTNLLTQGYKAAHSGGVA